jgi:hypothetical protein
VRPSRNGNTIVPSAHSASTGGTPSAPKRRRKAVHAKNSVPSVASATGMRTPQPLSPSSACPSATAQYATGWLVQVRDPVEVGHEIVAGHAHLARDLGVARLGRLEQPDDVRRREQRRDEQRERDRRALECARRARRCGRRRRSGRHVAAFSEP